MNKIIRLNCNSLIAITLLLSSISASSQMRIGDFDIALYKFKNLDKKTVSRFKEKTTKFILPDYYPISSYQEILNEVWDITPFNIISSKDFDESSVKVDDVLAEFLYGGITKIKSSGMRIDYGYHVLNFTVIDKLKKKPKEDELKWVASKIATIYFTPDIDLRLQAGANVKEPKGDFLNFRLGYLKNFLQFVNSCVKENNSVNLYDDYTKPELKNLKDKTLYIDNNFIYGYNAFNGNEKDAPKIEDLVEDFSFKYKVVDYEEIEKMILNGQSTDFYYLMYNQVNSNKIITVINGKTGNIVYQNHSTMSYNIKPKDFKELDKQIKKAK